jgi:predicted cupin superfamily sugar epimerase
MSTPTHESFSAQPPTAQPLSAHTLSARDVIRLLDLKPHPEGGHYRETFRDAGDMPGGRGASTAIYFLLAAGERSHWHRVDAPEVWHFYAGAPLELSQAESEEGPVTTQVLGPDLQAGQRPQAVVPADVWQAAETLGPWTLVGCTVAPAFVFPGFELAPKGWAPKGDANR